MLALFISTLILGIGIGLLGGISIGYNSCLDWVTDVEKGDK